MKLLSHELRLFFVALQFLTRLPVPRWVGYDPLWLNACVRHFPLVGALVGAVGAAVLLGAAMLWPPGVAALLALAATVLLTGAFHEDGLADTFDALGGAVSRERALAIMKDSRIGSYGAMALVLVLGTRLALLAALLSAGAAEAGDLPAGAWAAAGALLLSQVLGRAAAVVVMARLPYAGDAEHAKAKPLATSVRPLDVAVAVGWALALAGACHALGLVGVAPRLLLALAAALGTALAMSRWLRRRLGGYTGDTLGATEQLAETAVLLAMAAAWPA